MKKVNEIVVVQRKYKTADGITMKDKEVHINEVRSGEIPRCPECKEVVKNYSNSNPSHYEHMSRDGNPCSFKTKDMFKQYKIRNN